MLQFYFLSIMLNLVTGMILVYGKNFTDVKKEKKSDNHDDTSLSIGDDKKNTMKTVFGNNAFFDDKTFRLVLGVLTVFVGLMKLLSVVHNDVPVVGDIIPALAGLFGGFCLLVEYYCQSASGELKLPDIIQRLFVDDRRYLGYFCITAAVLHFAFPDVLLL
ncbi:MAG TPA: hypothetical protein DCL73_12695 [Treponema sp.]|nr:hypothetical protein [Treponema sp.]